MRKIQGKTSVFLAIWGTFTVLLHLYTALYGVFEPRLQRSIHVLLLLPIVFIIYPMKKTKIEQPHNFSDWILAILALFPSLYIILNREELNMRIEQVTSLTTIQVVLGVIIILLVIEACRRAVSVSFASVVTIILIFMFISPYLPGPFQ